MLHMMHMLRIMHIMHTMRNIRMIHIMHILHIIIAIGKKEKKNKKIPVMVANEWFSGADRTRRLAESNAHASVPNLSKPTYFTSLTMLWFSEHSDITHQFWY